jgi:hypothetical protein
MNEAFTCIFCSQSKKTVFLDKFDLFWPFVKIEDIGIFEKSGKSFKTENFLVQKFFFFEVFKQICLEYGTTRFCNLANCLFFT